MNGISEEIYQMLIRALHITYEPDTDTIQRITDEAKAGIEEIQKYGDPDATCIPGTISGRLLCEYVMRAEAGAAETFRTDFAQDILEMHQFADVRRYAEAIGYAETGE